MATFNLTDEFGNVNNTAHGDAVINNTSYSYSFVWYELNSTHNGGIYAFISLYNSTYVYRSTSTYTRTWTNDTTLNVTYISVTNVLTTKNTTYSSNFVNDTFKSTYSYMTKGRTYLPHPVIITTTKDSSQASYFNVTERTYQQDGNVTFSFHAPNKKASGYFVLSDPNGTENVIGAEINGTALNGSTPENFLVSVNNGNGTISANNDPSNVSLDPSYYYEYFWWGKAVMVVAKATVPYWADWAISIVDGVLDAIGAYVLNGILVDIGVAAAGAISLLIGIAGILLIADFFTQMSLHETTNYNFVLYLEGGCTISWLTGINDPYAEMGFYSDQYVNIWDGQPVHTAWQYYPFWNLYEGILAQWLESPHQSAFPPADSGWIPW